MASWTTLTTSALFAAAALPLQTVALSPNYEHNRVHASQAVKAGAPPMSLTSLAAQPNVARLMRVFPAASWEALFPNANRDVGPNGEPYNYHNLLSAVWKFPAFCGEPGQTDEECLHELVVMFAHFVQETGGKRGADDGVEDGLYWQREIGCYSASNPHGAAADLPKCSGYCNEAGIWGLYPCGDRAYYGRGAKQLSWNYNYAFFSKKMTGSADTYLLEPDRIITDGWPALASAIWFWMTPQMPKPSMHEVITGLWAPNGGDAAAGLVVGFGTTTNIINGAQECGRAAETPQSAFRIHYYRALCDRLGAACFPSATDSCASPMQSQFPASGTAASGPLFFLDQAWSGVEECKPVSYQMPFVAGLDELACQCHFWPDSEACSGGAADNTEDVLAGEGEFVDDLDLINIADGNAAVDDADADAGVADSPTGDNSAAHEGEGGGLEVAQVPASCSGGASEWSSCLEHHCCGDGLTCFEQSQWWAACKRSCDPSSDWSCRVLSPAAADGQQPNPDAVEGTGPVDCVGAYGSYSECSTSCGSGTQSRVFSVSQAAANGGASCPVGDGSVDTQTCTSAPCPTTTKHLRGSASTVPPAASAAPAGDHGAAGCEGGAPEWGGCMDHHCCGAGLTCFQQNAWWAQCLTACDPVLQQAATGAEWSCAALVP